jgi:sortase A
MLIISHIINILYDRIILCDKLNIIHFISKQLYWISKGFISDKMLKKILIFVLIIAGIIIIGSAVYMRVSSEIKQKNMLNIYEKSIDKEGKKDIKNVSNIDTAVNVNTNAIISKSDDPNLGGLVGEIIIPKINLKAVIGEGTDMETLKYALGHFTGTAMPGAKGNFCVAGHRSYTYSEMFNRLDELVVGDEITVKTVKNEFRYKIIQKKVVLPEEVSVLDQGNDHLITLITCTPIRVATHRLIIIGKLE